MQVLSRFLLLLLLSWSVALAQQATIRGKITDKNNDLLPAARAILLRGEGNIVLEAGRYTCTVQPGEIQLQLTQDGFDTAIVVLEAVADRTYERNVKLVLRSTETVVITGRTRITAFDSLAQMERMRAEDLRAMANATSVERAIGLITGGSNNEFSSQYRVRGGNFDENLVYVNGIEVYRPFLIRSGQQEGLGFSNPALVQEIQFSTGGFAAAYGDKLSSVLDVNYRTPSRFRGSAEAGILTTNIHFEGTSRSKKRTDQPGDLTWLVGARRYQPSYFLSSIDVQGEYKPIFYDLQSMVTYAPMRRSQQFYRQITRRNGQKDSVALSLRPFSLSLFATGARNRYYFEPVGREATFGEFGQAIRVRTAFEGREYTAYTTSQVSLKADYSPTPFAGITLTASAFLTREDEVFDVEGGYMIGEVNTNFDSENFNQTDFDLGVGSEFRHARNYLDAAVVTAQLSGFWKPAYSRIHTIRWGLSYTNQHITDQIYEYNLIDSAQYVINDDNQFDIMEIIQAKANLNFQIAKGYIQHEWRMTEAMRLTWGVRAMQHSLNNKLVFSPRAQWVYDFSETVSKKPLRIRVATGVYRQPPFYREFRRLDGSLNLSLREQVSIHAITGIDYQFTAWRREFRMVGEIYGKYMPRVYPYEIDNVRVRYYPDHTATAYAYGLDLRVYGQFVKGLDSWASLNLLSTKEDADGDGKGYVSRPTDQRWGLSLYFQDELPINPTYKVHLTYIFNSGMHFGRPRKYENRTALQMPTYQRVDIGFSKEFTFKEAANKEHAVETLWATFEVFNLFGRSNTVSYNWIQDINNDFIPIPNYLSARLLNLRVVMNFK